MSRTVKVAVPHFAVAPLLLVESEYVLTLPLKVAKRFAEHLPLVLVKPPVEIEGFTDHMFWHARSHRDPAHRWLREALKEAAQAIE